jgi:hypothetical protein
MTEIVVVASAPGREHWLNDCLNSIGSREVLVLRQADTWELGKIKWLYENTTLDRFMFMQDTVVVKDESFFDMAFSLNGSVSITNDPRMFGMYMGIYTRDTLSKVRLYTPATKQDAIKAEIDWTSTYHQADPSTHLLFTDFTDATAKRKEERHGRINLVLENDYLIKYKGTWE